MPLDGRLQTGGLLRTTVTRVWQTAVAPQASVAVNVSVFKPATGVNVTWLPFSVPGETAHDDKLPSTSLQLNPDKVIGAREQAKIVVSGRQLAVGAWL